MNNFQKWLILQGYSRPDGMIWMKDGKEVGGAELFHKLEEWKKLFDKQNDNEKR